MRTADVLVCEVGDRTSGWKPHNTPDVQDDHSGGVHGDGGHVAGILLVPPQAQQGGVRLRALIDDGAMLLIPECPETLACTTSMVIA